MSRLQAHLASLIVFCAFSWSGALADDEPLAANDLSELSLEQLGNVKVTSVSRRQESLSNAAGSVYVITSEDIRRSGAKTLPQALRLAPTLQVARADANQYAISARGFDSVLVSAHPEVAEPAAAPRLRRSILVADDSVDGAESLAQLLRLMGHQAGVAHDGPEAFRALASGTFDGAILDIGMPLMNGYDLARRVREQRWGRSLLLVALSGWGQESDKQRARDAGFDIHLTKPMDPEQLAEVLRAREPAGNATDANPLRLIK